MALEGHEGPCCKQAHITPTHPPPPPPTAHTGRPQPAHCGRGGGRAQRHICAAAGSGCRGGGGGARVARRGGPCSHQRGRPQVRQTAGAVAGAAACAAACAAAGSGGLCAVLCRHQTTTLPAMALAAGHAIAAMFDMPTKRQPSWPRCVLCCLLARCSPVCHSFPLPPHVRPPFLTPQMHGDPPPNHACTHTNDPPTNHACKHTNNPPPNHDCTHTNDPPPNSACTHTNDPPPKHACARSYGAFMAANLLAHCPHLFAAGIARRCGVRGLDMHAPAVTCVLLHCAHELLPPSTACCTQSPMHKPLPCLTVMLPCPTHMHISHGQTC